MRWSLPISFFVHVAILLAAVVVLPTPDQFKVDEQESIPVEIINLEEFSKRQATKKDAPEPEPEKKVAPEIIKEPEITKIEPKAAEEIKQAAREPQPEPEPKPVPKPEPVEVEPTPPEPDPVKELIKETVQPEPEPEPVEKIADAKPVPMPRAKPKPPVKKIVEKKKNKKPTFDTNDVAALLNKIDDERAAPPRPEDEPGSPVLGDINSVLGSDDRVSAGELDWLRQQIGKCWNVPAGVRNAHNLIVRVQIQMDTFGNVLGQPVVLNNSSHPAFGAAARSSVAAVLGCQPYDKLPVEKYESWKNIIINFDPSKMLDIG